jgi:hypothetical protein
VFDGIILLPHLLSYLWHDPLGSSSEPLRIVGGRASNASRSMSTSIWDGISDFISSRQPPVRDCILSRLPEFADIVVERTSGNRGGAGISRRS